MLRNFNLSDRRILNFPAVLPCQSISPTTLLASLINLCQKISNCQLKIFTTQKRNARETIRQINILLVFFEEIRDRKLNLSESVLLCFSELHFDFQKILFLFEDCLREGAKLWILMKSQFVAAQFWVLNRSVATALDVLPINSIGVCSEVKEFVELVTKQARRAKFELDSDDEVITKCLIKILDEFEKRIEPDLSDVKRILDYLEIRTWSDCNKEIKFLEDEIVFEYSDCNNREISILSSLMGFVTYSRGVIFDTLDYRELELKLDQSECQSNSEIISYLNPEDFQCPISLELMTDPVTVSTGQTYDRSSIQKWLKAGNMICPKTGEILTSTELVPNSSLQKLIKQFCAGHNISLNRSNTQTHDSTRTIIPGSSSSAEAIKFLSEFLAQRLLYGTSSEKNKAAYEIRLLAKSNIFNRSCLIKAGTVPLLLNLLSSYAKLSQENAMAALLKLSKHPSGKKVIVERGGLIPIIAVLEEGLSLEARQLAGATIFYLSSVKEYRKLIGKTPEAIPGLVKLIKEGTTCGKKNGVVAIFGLMLLPKNKERVIDAGTIPFLIDIIASSANIELVTDSLAVLSALAENPDGTNAILQVSGLTTFTRILGSLSSGSGKEYWVSVLHSLCVNGGTKVVEVLAKDHGLMGPLYSLITDGTSQAKKKARLLIEILHYFNETNSSTLIW